jgi:hypothetical protein
MKLLSGRRIAVLGIIFLLLFFVSFGTGFANISVIREQIKAVEVKILGERVRLLKEKILGIQKPVPSPPSEPELSRRELAKSLENEIAALQRVTGELKPRMIQEETLRLEKRIAEINQAFERADSKEVLLSLQEELNNVLSEYEKLQEEIRSSLADSLRARQAVLLQEEIKLLREKILLIPRTPSPAVSPPPAVSSALDIRAAAEAARNQIEKARLKLLQAQVKAIQEKIRSIQK